MNKLHAPASAFPGTKRDIERTAAWARHHGLGHRRHWQAWARANKREFRSRSASIRRGNARKAPISEACMAAERAALSMPSAFQTPNIEATSVEGVATRQPPAAPAGGPTLRLQANDTEVPGAVAVAGTHNVHCLVFDGASHLRARRPCVEFDHRAVVETKSLARADVVDGLIAWDSTSKGHASAVCRQDEGNKDQDFPFRRSQKEERDGRRYEDHGAECCGGTGRDATPACTT
eukprot:CAMPEP_0170285996 /NCGR_PEP_ID=MMETSP0116_2-20130129/43052_1 /TAXON_ID=400756 /ORGANISM="Durinskia baltica, Strain CSIRO CS-38" /LENGTH=233 /DNA_ID=CAMNT_0010537407 /DNA_START=104 /DNA_END=801 /DNA_ORIENTATION=-